MPDTFSTNFACLQISPFETVILWNFWDIHPNSISKHAQVKHFPNGSANHARFTTIKRLNLPIKSRAFLTGRLSCVGVALNFNSLGRNGVTTFSWPGCFNLKACWLTWFIRKMPKFLRVFAQCALWYYESVRFIESTTCQLLVRVGNLN